MVHQLVSPSKLAPVLVIGPVENIPAVAATIKVVRGWNKGFDRSSEWYSEGPPLWRAFCCSLPDLARAQSYSQGSIAGIPPISAVVHTHQPHRMRGPLAILHIIHYIADIEMNGGANGEVILSR